MKDAKEEAETEMDYVNYETFKEATQEALRRTMMFDEDDDIADIDYMIYLETAMRSDIKLIVDILREWKIADEGIEIETGPRAEFDTQLTENVYHVLSADRNLELSEGYSDEDTEFLTVGSTRKRGKKGRGKD